ncbi:MAG TPA: spondin domain-containing protein, partial [Gemmatimonadales bacterium]|nr:spondin domain-containing protein [Gemmatimonadales bacterium]
LSEQGKHDPLDQEIRAATGTGGVSTLFESGPLRDFGDSLVVSVQLDEAHPLVSLVAMIAPSPDWFTGVSNLNLVENGGWVPSKSLTLYAYDSGGDDGTTYKADDQDTDPKKPTSRAMTRHFVAGGAPVPVATLTLTRK